MQRGDAPRSRRYDGGFHVHPNTAHRENVLARCNELRQDTSEFVITYHDVVWPFESRTGTPHLAKCPQGAQGAGNGQGGQGLARDFGTDEDG